MAVSDVITFGSAIADVILKLRQPFAAGEKTEAEKIGVFSGGAGTNAAVCLSRLGLKVGAVCRLGKDLCGDLIIKDLRKEKVDLRFLTRKDNETDLSVILVYPNGKRTILVCRGKTRLEKDDFSWQKIKGTKWFYLGSLEGNINLSEKLIAFACENNIKVAWNPGKRELKNREKIFALAKKVTVFSLNREEAEELLKVKFETRSFWQKARRISKSFIIVTNGRKGAYLLNNLNTNIPFYLPVKNGRVVDETGAGDAFSATFVAGLIKGINPQKAFKLAMQNAASVVRHFGAKEGMLKEELETRN